MGFGGGGSAGMTAHVHNNVPLQGGPLDFANDTISSMNAGSTTYSNGAALQELAIGNAGDQLVVNGGATAPEWAAGGAAGIWTAEGFESVGALQANLSVSGMTAKDIYQIIYNVAGDNVTTGQLSFTLNGIVSSTYNSVLLGANAGIPGALDRTDGIARFNTDRGTNAASRSGVIFIYTGDSNFGTGGNNGVNWRGYNTSNTAGGIVDYINFCSGGNDAITGPITSIQVFLSSGNIMGSIQVNSMNYQ